MNNNEITIGSKVEFFVYLGSGRMALASGTVVNRDGDHLFVREPNGTDHYLFIDEIEAF